jgi:predicted ester cyclase
MRNRPSPSSGSTLTAGEVERLVREQFTVIETADLALAEANVTADFINHRAATEPLAARGRGPAALHATACWLHDAFSDLRFDVQNVALAGEVAVAWVTLHGISTGPFVVYDSPEGVVTDVFPPTGRSFATRQVHWFRIVDGAIAEHDAVRDDLDMATQAGWIPPRPAYVARMLLARRRARRAARQPCSKSPDRTVSQ